MAEYLDPSFFAIFQVFPSKALPDMLLYPPLFMFVSSRDLKTAVINSFSF